jgi:hypothetical protein
LNNSLQIIEQLRQNTPNRDAFGEATAEAHADASVRLMVDTIDEEIGS